MRRAEALAAAGQTADSDEALAALAATAPGYLPVIEARERKALARRDWETMAATRRAEAEAAEKGTAFGPGTPVVPDPAWAAAAWVAAGDVYALRLHRSEDARAAYRAALALKPGYPAAREALVDELLRGGDVARQKEAAKLLEDRVGAESPARADEMLERLVVIHELAGDRAEPLRALERLWVRRQNDAVLGFRLEHAYALAGRHEDRVAVLGRLADGLDDPRRKAALLHEIGRVRDQELDDLDGAVVSYRAAMLLDPLDGATRGSLLALLRRAGRWDELAAELRAEATADGPNAARALRTAAVVLERNLGRPAEAAAVYRELIDRGPVPQGGADPMAVRGLAGALAGQPADLPDVLEREIAMLPAEASKAGGAARTQALVRLVELYDRLDRVDDATAAYTRAAELNSAATVRALLGGGPERNDDTAKTTIHAAWALAELAARRSRPAELVQALSALARHTADDRVRGDLLEEVAWLDSADAGQAVARFEEVARHAPERPGAQLGRALLAARRRDNVELSAALVAQAERATDKRVAAALFLRAATIAEVAGGEDAGEKAAALASRALELLPDDEGALLAVAERPVPVAENAGRDADVARAQLLARRALLAHDGAPRAELEMERAPTCWSAPAAWPTRRALSAPSSPRRAITSAPSTFSAAWRARREITRPPRAPRSSSAAC